VKLNFPTGAKISLVSTIQFTTLQGVSTVLRQEQEEYQSRLLSPREIFGFTAPITLHVDILISLRDGCFNLGAAMIPDRK
jgi:hypothetical protein